MQVITTSIWRMTSLSLTTLKPSMLHGHIQTFTFSRVGKKRSDEQTHHACKAQMGSISVTHTMAPRAFRAVQQPFPTYIPRDRVTLIISFIRYKQGCLRLFIFQKSFLRRKSPLHNHTQQLVCLQTLCLWSFSTWQRQDRDIHVTHLYQMMTQYQRLKKDLSSTKAQTNTENLIFFSPIQNRFTAAVKVVKFLFCDRVIDIHGRDT